MGTWPEPMPAPSGVCIAGHKRISLSQLCGGRTRAGTVRMPAVLPDDGAWGVAAVCRRPVKDPPRQFGERAFTGFPWMQAWLCGLVGQMSVWEAITGVVCAPTPTALSVASQWRSLAGHILRSEGKAGRRRGASRSQSACPPASFRTGHAVFTASGFPVSLQSSGVWSVLAFRKSADFGACGPQEEGLNACREGEGRSLTRIQVDRVDQA